MFTVQTVVLTAAGATAAFAPARPVAATQSTHKSKPAPAPTASSPLVRCVTSQK
jgi:hypothetical protein